jgi:hypothetical protein
MLASEREKRWVRIMLDIIILVAGMVSAYQLAGHWYGSSSSA